MEPDDLPANDDVPKACATPSVIPLLRGLPTACLVLIAITLSGCVQGTPPPTPGELDPRSCSARSRTAHSVYLVGDAGQPVLPVQDGGALVDPVMTALRDDVSESVRRLGRDQVGVIFLGDNVYYRGLVPEGHRDRRRGERILETQIAAAGEAWAVFVAGNHDWDVEGAGGWENVTAQRAFLARQGPRVAMFPPGGCAGPTVRDFGSHLRFVFIDPIGYTHVSRYPEQHHDVCPYANLSDAFRALAETFAKPQGHHVVLALHHPLITAGPHGGNYGWKQHIFPLTDFWSWAWLPLPVIGSAYPLSRMLGVTTTDTSSAQYLGYTRGIYRASTIHAPMLIAAGHEHSLQVHHDLAGLYYAVSGAGSSEKPDRVSPMDTLMRISPGSEDRAAWARPGYMRLDSHEDGELDLTVLGVTARRGSETLFSHCLADGPAETP